MLCVDLKNSFYQLPDIHKGLYDFDNGGIDEDVLDSSTKVQTIQEEKIMCNEFFSDLAKQEQCIGKLLTYYFTKLHNSYLQIKMPFSFLQQWLK